MTEFRRVLFRSERFNHASSRTTPDSLAGVYADVQGPSIGEIPQSLVSAPVHYVDLSTGKETDLRFIAGMFGVEQHVETRALSASFAWAIVYDKPG